MGKTKVNAKKKDYLQCDDDAKILFWWKYDDGTYASVRYDAANHLCSELEYYADRHSLECVLGSKKKQCLEIRKVKFDAGIKKMKKKQKDEYKKRKHASLKAGFGELQSMFSCYSKDAGQHQILKLFSLVMAGYIARMVLKKENSMLYFSRAPIVRVIKHRDDLCGGFEHLQRIMVGLVINTTRANLFDVINPASIPSRIHVTGINQCAYADISNAVNDTFIPTIYRDTAVLVHTGFFKDKEVHEFVERNKWCSTVLFNVKKRSNWNRLIAEVDLNNMSLGQWTWDCEKINYLMNYYTLWLSAVKEDDIQSENYITSWSSFALDVVRKYNLVCAAADKTVLQGSELELARLQVMAICSFIKYLKYQNILSEEAHEDMLDAWINELFPGSRSQESFMKSEQRKQEQERNNMIKMVADFEKLLKNILEYENGAKVYLLKKRDKYPASPDLDVEKHHWAFLSMMSIDGLGKKIPAVKITYSMLFKLANKFNLLQGGHTKQADLKAAIESVGGRRYIHSMGNAYINFENAKESEKTRNALTLVLQKINFIDKDIQRKLMDRVSEKY